VIINIPPNQDSPSSELFTSPLKVKVWATENSKYNIKTSVEKRGFFITIEVNELHFINTFNTVILSI
jgi:hypothetical protein